jgi:hypothetical protein
MKTCLLKKGNLQIFCNQSRQGLVIVCLILVVYIFRKEITHVGGPSRPESKKWICMYESRDNSMGGIYINKMNGIVERE